MSGAVDLDGDVNALAARMTEVYERGGYAAAEPYAERILAKVDRWYLRSHPDALYLRAHVRHALSQAATDRGDHDAARRHVADGLKAATAAGRLRDGRAAFELVMLLMARADLHLSAGDRAAAAADYDAALDVDDPLGHPMWAEAQVHLRLGRGWARQRSGELDLAEADVRAALDLASEHEPRLVSLCLDRLAMIRRLAGATDAAVHHVRAAEAVAATQPLDAARRGERARHAASLALEQGDADAAERHLDEAERQFLEVGNQRQAAGVAAARAEVLRLRGDTDGAIREARRAAERCRTWGEPVGETEACTVLGLALDDAGRSEDALAAHDRARALVTEPVELVRVDVRRAVAAYNAFVRRANALRSGGTGGTDDGSSSDDEPAAALDRAIDIAVPCALAADAIRFGMPAGDFRESWTAEAARPVVDSALRMLTAAGRADEILDLLEHVAASAALEPLRADPRTSQDVVGLDLLATPPRVRSMPDGDSPLEWAARAVRERYGFEARSPEVVDAW
ncbi:hypothetical protein AAG589_04765 [Isoptericola sp. F-RaC21]|uniref:hypothetical protein n=1 Tax=Isoptericola sp. F-RaC21 TaxID=3141452 RepID=UPI00315B43E9